MPSIATLHGRLARGETSCEALVAAALDAARAPVARHVFTALYEGPALAAARAADAARAAGRTLPPLAGLPVTIKDLFDVAGEATTAGSAVRAGCAPAAADAVAVARLRAHGAAILGKTAMTEFAFSGVGINPHTGTPRNPADAEVARIPGGSSAGAAVSVALGIAVAALGSDTGGSIRIPAALCGLVGFKPTQSRTPRAGAVELARSFDTVCGLATSVADCIAFDAAIAGAPLAVLPRSLRGQRFAVPQDVVFDGIEPAVQAAFDAACERLAAAGASVERIALPLLGEIATANAPAGLSSIECFAAHGHWLDAAPERLDARVAQRIAPGRGASAADYLRIQDRRRAWIARMDAAVAGFDALLLPTTPITAPPVDALATDDAAFFRANGLLLRNTFAINWWDGCAFSLPMPVPPGALPAGLMLAARGGRDAALAASALAVEAALAAWPSKA